MPQFSYREYLLSKAKTHGTKVREKISLPDPTGAEEPLKVVLEGACDPTDEGYASLAARQPKPITTKQKQPETATKIQATLVMPFQGNELADIILERSDLIDQIAQEQVETVKNKKSKKKDKEESTPADGNGVNRIAEQVGANGHS